MELARMLPVLLVTAWLLPLGSFALIVLFGPRMGKAGRGAAYVATGAIATGFVLSSIALVGWLWVHPLAPAAHHAGPAAESAGHLAAERTTPAAEHATPAEHAASAEHASPAKYVSGVLYRLAQFGTTEITLSYYIDSLTVAMFVMVTLVATCIHVYSFGYMHEELHEVTDPLVQLSNGQNLKRRGRFHRFYQYLSLFCFSMLGLVLAGNIAMVFVFWELVGICSYFLIGFYFERKSASNAANKAFIVNRVGDFGMLVGMMCLWGSLGTFSFANYQDAQGQPCPGIFSLVRPADSAEPHALQVPDGMVRAAAREHVAEVYRTAPSTAAAKALVTIGTIQWRQEGLGYGLLVVAGLGIFCGCVGKSAQFPLHVWLPDAMEGPTPVSALIHAATMVAAGVYLVGRFYPVFTPEVLLVIACVGCITLFIAATIALTATDIKRVLAYSTVSQLGYMMFALGVGGWLAGLFHLFNHAFFKALLFLGSGSVIHATHTNEMPKMGGLRKKMPWTAGTMLVGCLAIAGAGLPLAIPLGGGQELLLGLSGFYSKDSILAQAYLFNQKSPAYGWLFYVAAGGAALTAFYMFRLWFMTFAGEPRDKHVYEHAHESPRVMYGPLVVLAVMSVISGWRLPLTNLSLSNLLEQARPAGTESGYASAPLLSGLSVPAEHLSHAAEIHHPITWLAFGMAAAGFLLALAMYGLRRIDPALIRKVASPVYWFLWNKWLFDPLYRLVFVRPTLLIAGLVAGVDRRVIDWIADHLALAVRGISSVDDWIDRTFVDRFVNVTASWTYGTGVWLRNLQTGRLRQYVMLLAVGTVGLFVLVTLFWTVVRGG